MYQKKLILKIIFMIQRFAYIKYMQNYVIGKCMFNVEYPDLRTKDLDQEQVMNLHIKRYSEYLDLYKKLTKKVRTGSNFTWITISVKTATKPKAFFKACAQFVEKKYVDKWFYVFEQRGDREEVAGCGLHCHMVASYKRYLYLDEFKKNVLRHFAGYATSAAVWITYIEPRFVEDKVNYMCGDKFEKKLMKVSIDRIWRVKIKIEDYYTNDFNLFIEHGKARSQESVNEGSEEGGRKYLVRSK